MTARAVGRHHPDYNPRAWDQRDGRRHLTRTQPADFDWFSAPGLPELGPYAPVPPFPPPGETFDVETTQDIPLPLGVLPAALAGPDPEPVQIDAWTGPLPIVAPERNDEPPSMWFAAACGLYGLALIAFALFMISLGGGG